MITKAEMIEIIKAENPTLRVGDNEVGYTQLSAEEYEATVAEWAANRLAKQARLAEAEADAESKLDAANKLIALGINPKVLGL